MANTIPLQMYFEGGDIHTEYAKDTCKKVNEIYSVLEAAFEGNFTRIKFKEGQRFATGQYQNPKGESFYFIVANLTFMGGKEGQHPKDLKRIQYNIVWREFYEKYSQKGKVLWLGLYSYKNMNVFAFFEPKTYLKKHEGKSMTSKGGHKANYSCHIYLNDLYQGFKNKHYSKTDKNNNVVGAISEKYIKQYFDGGYEEKNPIIDTIEKINTDYIKWNEWITADNAITYMKNLESVTGFPHWKQNLWNGWYIEALYSEYLHDHPSEYMDYIATTKDEAVLKEYNDCGLDLAFPKVPYHFIGDLKAVCEGNGKMLLNDEEHVKKALKKYKKIWFVIYIHDKRPGKTNDYEMVKWRNHYILDSGEWKPSKEHPDFNEMSAPNTPHSISFSEMVIIELNDITKDKYFTIGAQYGLNSDGKERNDKFKVSKSLIKQVTDDNFAIYRYKPDATDKT